MVSIAAMMSVDIRTLYLNPLGKEDEAKQERQKFNVHESDHLTLLNIYMQFIRAGKSRSWSEDNFLDFKTLMRAVDIRVQFVERMRVAKLPLRSSPSSSANNHYRRGGRHDACLLYTSDAADEEDSVDLGGRRIIKKKKKKPNNE
eukprot:TRINITY_DN38855_c0_g1_i1.p2 TRINITY_DN38855_c0_g1~~TRINITY_DN38855_c0_g1_i1.p2  ORF type:complete len:145 (-),score=33.49 TRINITY_DN38855_c0_g1_i1:48-482(-)